MKEVLLVISMLSVFLLWCSPSKADEHDECLGKCDSYEDYDCNSFIGVCEQCVLTSDSPKCTEYFESLREPSTPDRPHDEPTPTTEAITIPPADNVSDHQDIIGLPQDPETQKSGKGRNQPNRDIHVHHIGGGNLQPKPTREEKHTNIIIIVATGSIITLAGGVVVKIRRGNRSPTGQGTSTSNASGDVEAQSDEGLLQEGNGAAGETAVGVEETAL